MIVKNDINTGNAKVHGSTMPTAISRVGRGVGFYLFGCNLNSDSFKPCCIFYKYLMPSRGSSSKTVCSHFGGSGSIDFLENLSNF
eukprot:2998830-Amphidinium_carterae.1